MLFKAAEPFFQLQYHEWPLGAVAFLYSLEVHSRLHRLYLYTLCCKLSRIELLLANNTNNDKDVHLLFPIFKWNLISSNIPRSKFQILESMERAMSSLLHVRG